MGDTPWKDWIRDLPCCGIPPWVIDPVPCQQSLGSSLLMLLMKCWIDYFLQQGLEVLDTQTDPLVSSCDWVVMGESRMQRWEMRRRAGMVLLLSWNPSPSLAGLPLSGDWLCEPGRTLAMPDLSPEQSLTLWKHFAFPPSFCRAHSPPAFLLGCGFLCFQEQIPEDVWAVLSLLCSLEVLVSSSTAWVRDLAVNQHFKHFRSRFYFCL